MADSYSVRAELSAVDRGFTSSMKSAGGALDSLGSKIKSGLGFGILTGAGQAAFNTIKNSVGGLIGEISSANATWKTFTGNMQIIGKSTKEINKVKSELQSFAETTVYSSSDMATTYAQMAAVGVKNTTKLVKGFGGLAAAAENPQQAMKTLSQQGTQMAAKPKVAWQDFKLMLEQTPAGIAAVAKEMGMTTSQMVTAVQDGKIKTEDFFDAITKAGNSKAFQKLATQPKTVGQAMDGLKETIGNKLTPAFDVLSQVGINALSGISDWLGKIDAQSLANKVKSVVNTISQYWNTLKTSFAGVGTALKNAAVALGKAFGIIGTEAKGAGTSASQGSTLLEKFGSVCKTVAGWITSAAGFIERNAATIKKVTPWILGAVVAFKGFKIVQSIAPGLASFATSLLKMAGQGIVTLAGKLFGISAGQKAVGTASKSSNPSLLKSAVAFLAMGAGILLAAGGIALLAQSAIALASGGWGAIAVMVGLIAVIAGLAIGAAVLGPALTAGAVGFLAFGAAIALVGIGMLAAGAGILLLTSAFPVLIQYGLQACIPLMALGGALAIFSLGALAAGAACIVLGAGLLIVATALLLAGTAMLLFGTGALMAAGAIALISLVMPTLAAYGTQAAVSLIVLSAALVIFGAGALIAGAGVLVLSAALLIASVAIIAVGAALLVVGLALTVIGAGIALCGVGFMLIGTFGKAAANGLKSLVKVLPKVVWASLLGAPALLVLGAALIVFGTGAMVAGAGTLLLAAGLAAVSGGMLLLSMVMPMLTKNAQENTEALGVLAVGLAAFGAGAMLAAPGVLLLGVGVTTLGAGLIVLAAGAALAAGGLSLIALALPLITKNAAENMIALIQLGIGLTAFSVGAALAATAALALSVGLVTFGAAITVCAAGTLIMAAALLAITTQMKSIADNAKSAENSIVSMQNSVDTVESGLKLLGNIAKIAMKALTSAFDNAADKAKAAGLKLGMSFLQGMQSTLMQSPTMAKLAISLVNLALMGGRKLAYTAGFNISAGFAIGMLSQLALIEAAATKMVIAADKAIKAKAKIHSPSKLTYGEGDYFVDGFANSILDGARRVWKATQELVSIPAVETPNLAMAYSGSLSSDYEYTSNAEYVIEVPLTVDGREVAKATATYTQAELNKNQARENRKYGKA